MHLQLTLGTSPNPLDEPAWNLPPDTFFCGTFRGLILRTSSGGRSGMVAGVWPPWSSIFTRYKSLTNMFTSDFEKKPTIYKFFFRALCPARRCGSSCTWISLRAALVQHLHHEARLKYPFCLPCSFSHAFAKERTEVCTTGRSCSLMISCSSTALTLRKHQPKHCKTLDHNWDTKCSSKVLFQSWQSQFDLIHSCHESIGNNFSYSALQSQKVPPSRQG